MDVDQAAIPLSDNEFDIYSSSLDDEIETDIGEVIFPDHSVPFCEGVNRNGIRCGRHPRKGDKFCVHHDQMRVRLEPKVQKRRSSTHKHYSSKFSLYEELIKLSKRVDKTEEHEVARILCERSSGSKREYLVSWKESWVTRRDLNCPKLLSKYKRSVRK
jgi:hypothetical protein